MSQRLKSSDIGHVNCAKYNKILQREKERSTKLSSSTEPTKTTPNNMKCKLGKKRPQNVISSARTESNCNINGNLIDDAEEYSNRQFKSESNHESKSWSNLLKNPKNLASSSTFGNFDPLRTLHFLAKELQFQMETIMPQQTNLHKIVSDIQDALKRVPPEVASTVHLQQAIELLPINKLTRKSSKSDKGDKLVKLDKMTQTLEDDNEQIHKLMEESTQKLENSCRQMEILCGRLKIEKAELDKQLKLERDIVRVLRLRINDLENENGINDKLKLENMDLRQKVAELNEKLVSEGVPRIKQLEHLIDEIQQSKNKLEQECNEYKNKFELCTIEKCKFEKMLEVRTEQVREIEIEMKELQRTVNEQLYELHNDAQESMPKNDLLIENGLDFSGDGHLPSTIHSYDDDIEKNVNEKTQNVFHEVPCGDSVKEKSTLLKNHS